MDALALLCTLYAEGPLTLARLREADCASIEDVLARDARDLASILSATEATAQRFQREARNLHERVGAEGMIEVRSGSNGTRAIDSRRTESSSAGSTGAVPSRPNVLDRVLAAWRERDEHDEHAEQNEHADYGVRDEGDGSISGAGEREAILRPAAPARHAASNPARGSGSIAVGAVDGLDADASAALARAGVRDLRALAVCDALVVAPASGLSWTQVSRLRALARRVPGIAQLIARESELVAEYGIAEERISPSERPLVAHEALTPLDRSPGADRMSSTERTPSAHFARHTAEGAGGPFA